MSETPSSSCLVGEVSPARAAAVLRAAARRVGLSTVDAHRPPAGAPACELSWIGSCTPLGGTGELTVQFQGPPATAAALFAAMSAETGSFVVSDTVGAWYAGHPVAFDPSARGSSLPELVFRLTSGSSTTTGGEPAGCDASSPYYVEPYFDPTTGRRPTSYCGAATAAGPCGTSVSASRTTPCCPRTRAPWCSRASATAGPSPSTPSGRIATSIRSS